MKQIKKKIGIFGVLLLLMFTTLTFARTTQVKEEVFDEHCNFDVSSDCTLDIPTMTGKQIYYDGHHMVWFLGMNQMYFPVIAVINVDEGTIDFAGVVRPEIVILNNIHITRSDGNSEHLIIGFHKQ